MKKKILFVIPNLGPGGAEKSLVNLLNTIDPNYYSVDLFMFSHTGLFLSQVPNFVNVLPNQKNLNTFQKPLLKSIVQFIIEGKFSAAHSRLRFAQVNRSIFNVSVSEQKSWEFKSDVLKNLPTIYDAAIGFLEKSSIYFIVDHVNALKKIGFIHTYYSKLEADKNFDERYFSCLDDIISVSQECADDLRTNFPKFSNKNSVIHNVVSSKLIQNLSHAKSENLLQNSLVSVGRLVSLKGFDLAIESANLLKEKGIDFNWYIIGEGDERKNLEELIDKYKLKNCFHLLGLKQNPYPYIKQASVFVQPSRYEGKSISVDEAKILAKPIILTNFTTAKDQIQNGFNGLICEMTAKSLAENIQKYWDDPKFTQKVIDNLKAEEFGTESEIKKLYKLIDE